MKKYVKYAAVAAVVLTLATAGASSARAGGWPVAGGFAAGVVVSRAVAPCPAPAYYGYGPRVYAAPYCAPVPVVVRAPVCYAPPLLGRPFGFPVARGGFFAGRARGFGRR